MFPFSQANTISTLERFHQNTAGFKAWPRSSLNSTSFSLLSGSDMDKTAGSAVLFRSKSDELRQTPHLRSGCCSNTNIRQAGYHQDIIKH